MKYNHAQREAGNASHGGMRALLIEPAYRSDNMGADERCTYGGKNVRVRRRENRKTVHSLIKGH